MKLKAALAYRLRYIAISGAIYFGFYIVLGIIFPLIAAVAIDTTEVTSEILISPLIYGGIMAFIGAASDFKLFIQNGVSRNTIFVANLISNLIQSIILAALELLLREIIDLLPLSTNFHLSTFLLDGYTNGEFLPTLFLFSWLLFIGSCIGLLIGTFNDRVHGMKKIVIILLLILIPTALLSIFPIATGNSLSPWVATFFTNVIGFQNGEFQLATISISILIGIIICLALTYLMNQGREVRRLNA